MSATAEGGAGGAAGPEGDTTADGAGGALPLPSWLDLTGTVAVVTGGGTHLGRAMAAALGQVGAAVYLVGRRLEVVEAAAAELRQRGVDAHARAGDASAEEAMAALVGDILARHGRLDTMVCNAGGAVGAQAVPQVRSADLEETLRRNVTTTLVCAQVAARAMMPRRRGAIVTVGSIHASLGSDKRLYATGFRRSAPTYHAAKGAVVNLTRALACELGEWGITVNCISPGQIPKGHVDAVTRERFRQAIPLGRVGEPEDLRGAVVLLASGAGRWITGHNLVVDGGWSAW